MRSASTARQPVSASSASSAPMSQEAPTTPPAPRTRPTRMGSTVPLSTDCQAVPFAAQRVRNGPTSRRKPAQCGGGEAGAARRGLRNRLPNVGCMTAEDRARTAATPRMRLVFECIDVAGPLRPVQVAAVLSGLEEVFLVTLLRDAPPPDHRRREWAWDFDAQSLHIVLAGLRLESPLDILLALPWHVYTVPFSAFAYGWPTSSAPPPPPRRCSTARARTSGAAVSRATAPKAEWMEWQAWLEYKHEEVERTVPFRLRRGRHRADAAAGPRRAARAERPASWAYSLAHADPHHRRLHRPAVRRQPRRRLPARRPTPGPTRPGCSRSPRR